MPGDNAELIRRFYAAFAARDGGAMASLYAPDARFSDPVFGELRREQPGAMWRMLTGRAQDLEVELLEHEADGDRGSARWVARYTFTQTGRPVRNEVQAEFVFFDGLIAQHRDQFDFYRWSRQALGLPGLLLGWTPILRGATRRRARASLDQFVADETRGP